MIKIEELLPLMKKGWVAMDENGDWYWYLEKPKLLPLNKIWRATSSLTTCKINRDCFDIALAYDWTQSLMRCGNE